MPTHFPGLPCPLFLTHYHILYLLLSLISHSIY